METRTHLCRQTAALPVAVAPMLPPWPAVAALLDAWPLLAAEGEPAELRPILLDMLVSLTAVRVGRGKWILEPEWTALGEALGRGWPAS